MDSTSERRSDSCDSIEAFASARCWTSSCCSASAFLSSARWCLTTALKWMTSRLIRMSWFATRSAVSIWFSMSSIDPAPSRIPSVEGLSAEV